MICEKCKEAGLISKIEFIDSRYLESSIYRSEAFYDEKGQRHDHEHFGMLAMYRCTNNHKILIETKTVSPRYSGCCELVSFKETTYSKWRWWNSLGVFK